MTSTLMYQLRWALPLWLVLTATNWLPDNRVSLRLRGWLASHFLSSCGSGFQLGANVTLLNPSGLVVGNDVYIARGTWLNCLGGLTLEDEVVIAPYVVISTLQHAFKDGSVRFGGSSSHPVVVGRGTWLAAHATVKCGVEIGPGNLVASNASVVESTPPHVVVGGVPAKVLGPVREGGAGFTTRAEFLQGEGRTHPS